MDVYLLPGIAGSVLDRDFATRAWLNYTDFVYGRFGSMELAEDGLSPGGKDGERCFRVKDPFTFEYHGMVYPYYTKIMDWLLKKGFERGWRVTPWPYDWRMSCEVNGQVLAQEILTRWGITHKPCTIVAHSMGGIIARMAYRQLVKYGRPDLIRRIVCLGTPHGGSYYMLKNIFVQAPSEAETIFSVNFYSLIVPGRFIPLKLIAFRYWTKQEIANLFLTWPSVYQLLPHLGVGEETYDPKRPEIWEESFYPEGFVLNKRVFNDTKDRWHALLRSPETLPLQNVLVNVYSGALVTDRALVRVEPKVFDRTFSNQALDLPRPIYDFAGAGDSVVPVESAVLGGYPKEELISTHSGLPNVAIEGDRLLHYIEHHYDEAIPVDNKIQPGEVAPLSTLPWPVAKAANATNAAGGECVHNTCHC